MLKGVAIGACGVPGHTFMGVYKSLQKLRAGKTNLTDYIMTARIEQGELEALKLSERERKDIVRKLNILTEQQYIGRDKQEGSK